MDIKAVVKGVLAADLACRPEDLDGDGVSIAQWSERPGRRRYPPRGHALHLVTMGRGVVVTCHASRMEWARALLGGLDRDEVFSPAVLAALRARVVADGQRLHGPNVAWVCGPDEVRPGAADVAVAMYEGGEVSGLWRWPGFEHALGYGRTADRPDVLACAVAAPGGSPVAVAGASADCEAMWQVGVDVLPEWRGRGLGRAVAAEVTRAVLARGRLPFYAAAASNVASLALAASVGYRPNWTFAYARRE